MKKILIVLIFSILVQFNAFADEASLTFSQAPTGTNFLSLIDDSNTKGSNTQSLSLRFILGYLHGIHQSAEDINMSAAIQTFVASEAAKKSTAGIKLTKEENELLIRARGAKSIAPIGLWKIPGGVTYGQQVSIIEKFLRDHPEKLHESAYTLVVQALTDAFKDSK